MGTRKIPKFLHAEIVRRIESGEKQTAIAHYFGVEPATICRINQKCKLQSPEPVA